MFPYLLRNLAISQPNQVWAIDITYIPMAHGFAYLEAVIDWYSRRVLAWRLSNTLESSFCVEALQEALARFPKPTIFNTDQGSQFTSCTPMKTLMKREPALAATSNSTTSSAPTRLSATERLRLSTEV